MQLDISAEPLDIAFHLTQPQLLACSTVEGSILMCAVPLDLQQSQASVQSSWPQHDETVARCLTWAAAGTNDLITGGRDGSWTIWDTATGKEVHRQTGAHDSPICRAIPLYQHLFATGDDEGVVNIWDSRSRELVRKYHDNEDYIADMAYDPAVNDRTFIVAGGDGYLSVFDLRKRELLARSDHMECELLSVAIMKNGKKCVVGMEDGALGVFNWGDWGDVKDRIMGHPLAVDSMVRYDQNTILTGSSDGFIRVVDIYPTQFAGVLGDQGEFPVERLSLSCDGRFVASSSHDAKLRFYDIEAANDDEEEEEIEQVDDEVESSNDSDDSDSSDVSSELPVAKKHKINTTLSKQASFFAGLEAGSDTDDNDDNN